MNDDVRAMFDRAAEIWCRHGVVDDQRHARLVRHFGDRGYVGDDPTRIGERFDEDRAGVLVNGGGEGGGIVGVDEAAFPAHLAKAQIGRASWRERVCQYVKISVVAGSLKKKK